MQIAKGTSVSDGIAIGKIHFIEKEATAVSTADAADPKAELQRFLKAQQQAISRQKTLYEKAKAEAGEKAAAVFEIHEMMLEDDDYVDAIRGLILDQHKSAEFAVQKATDDQAAVFASMQGNAYMQARSADVKDIGQALLDCLQNKEKPLQNEEPCILAADDLTPSETVQLDKTQLLGFVTRAGSANSHTAILARSMGIPALIQCCDVDKSWEGMPAILDSASGCVYLNPEPEKLSALKKQQKELQERQELLKKLKGKPDTTLDGKKIAVYANIGSPSDIKAVKENDAGGIGLFRSEFLYLNQKAYPSEEIQFTAYKEVLQAMGSKKVIIRTCDLGADKTADYMHLAEEANPALGLRAVRLCLTNRTLFKTQLRALLRASVYGNLSVMFPMIISVKELCLCKEILQECREELKNEGVSTGKVEVGIMVETPAAVICADELAQECDFFSIGTNDLTQYTCALDRQNPNLTPFFDSHHPAVLREIQMTIEAGHRHGCWVGICGELAADVSLTETFLRMGVDELSVNPKSVLPIRQAVRHCRLSDQPIS